jgi:NAD(P)-dependent dehydrogenase (short-subunit alcohol dehydrogenase family)
MFVKSLAEKLGDSGVRAFSIDPGGTSSIIPHNFVIYINFSFTAVQSGLLRHATPEFQKFIAEIKAAGGSCFLYTVYIQVADVIHQV